MRIDMLCTGEEVLAGQIVDTNGAWIGQRLLEVGLELDTRLTVGDRLDDLIGAFEWFAGKSDVVLVNGGLGPTEDDLSSAAMAQAIGVELELHQGWLDTISAWFARHGREMTPNNRKQALLPVGSVMIDNPVGTACGFRVRWKGTWFVFTPGPPHELKTMIEDQILPWLRQEFVVDEPSELYRMLTTGSGESALASQLASVEIPTGVELGYRASLPYIEIKLLRRCSVDNLRWHRLLNEVRTALGDNWLGDNIYTVADEVHRLLIGNQLTLTTAESCTGGLVASSLVELAGSSAYFDGGWVTYSNKAKQREIDVSEELLAEHGAVSVPTAIAMAQGARSEANTDLAISVTGIAGPDGGTEEKPVGMVCFGLAYEGGYAAQTFRFNAQRLGRNGVRRFAATIALDMVRRHLLEQSVFAEFGYLPRLDKVQG